MEHWTNGMECGICGLERGIRGMECGMHVGGMEYRVVEWDSMVSEKAEGWNYTEMLLS